jgi:D-amino peptidase
MKVMISVDIEGVTGAAHWDEALKSGPDHAALRARMTAEAAAAAEGAAAGGATEILVRDAHESARNVDPEALPRGVRLVRGWSGHPSKMIQGLDRSFDALILVGWHAAAGEAGSPLAHTINGLHAAIHLNGAPMSECVLYAHLAAAMGVPVAFVSGDAAVCAQARALNPACVTVATQEGQGASVVSRHPADMRAAIRDGCAHALRGDLRSHALPSAAAYRLEVEYKHPAEAFARSHYPGASPSGPRGVSLSAEQIEDVARAMLFL